jgi:hypothetical protein
VIACRCRGRFCSAEWPSVSSFSSFAVSPGVGQILSGLRTPVRGSSRSHRSRRNPKTVGQVDAGTGWSPACHSGKQERRPRHVAHMVLPPRLRGQSGGGGGHRTRRSARLRGVPSLRSSISGHACPGRATMDQWMPWIRIRVPAASAREPRPRPRPARCRRSAGGRRGRCARTPKARATQSWRTALGETSNGSTSLNTSDLNTSDLNTSDRRSTRARTTSDRLMPADCVCPPRVRSKCDGPTHHRLGPRRRSVHHRPRHHQATRAGEKTTKVLGRPGTKTT